MGDNYISTDAWRAHLAAERLARVHLVDPTQCDLALAALIQASIDIGFATFQMDGRRMHTKNGILDELAAAANFPSYCGRNWDAAEDLLRDLSWIPAKGYALVVIAGDELLRAGSREFGTFIQVVETAIQDWRDERGEYNERTAPIAFHFVLCGTHSLKAALEDVLTEPLCDHSS